MKHSGLSSCHRSHLQSKRLNDSRIFTMKSVELHKLFARNVKSINLYCIDIQVSHIRIVYGWLSFFINNIRTHFHWYRIALILAANDMCLFEALNCFSTQWSSLLKILLKNRSFIVIFFFHFNLKKRRSEMDDTRETLNTFNCSFLNNKLAHTHTHGMYGRYYRQSYTHQ